MSDNLPPLPEPERMHGAYGIEYVYTADQMHAYAAAAVAERDAEIERMKRDIEGLLTSVAELDAQVDALRADAERYRWLRSRKGLDLRSEPQPNIWTRMDGTKFSATHSLAEGGTRHAPADSLDATIDAAMLDAAIDRARGTT